MVEERTQGVSELEDQTSEVSQGHSSEKQDTMILEKVAVGTIVLFYTMLVAAIFHLHQWHFYLHCFSSGLVAWQFWTWADAEKDALDEIVEAAVGILVLLSAWISSLNGWLFWLYLLLVGIMGLGIALLRHAFRGELS